MSIIRSAVLCGSRSGDLVSEPHCSLPESGDTDILATHVSHHDLGGFDAIEAHSCAELIHEF